MESKSLKHHVDDKESAFTKYIQNFLIENKILIPEPIDISLLHEFTNIWFNYNENLILSCLHYNFNPNDKVSLDVLLICLKQYISHFKGMLERILQIEGFLSFYLKKLVRFYNLKAVAETTSSIKDLVTLCITYQNELHITTDFIADLNELSNLRNNYAHRSTIFVYANLTDTIENDTQLISNINSHINMCLDKLNKLVTTMINTNTNELNTHIINNTKPRKPYVIPAKNDNKANQLITTGYFEKRYSGLVTNINALNNKLDKEINARRNLEKAQENKFIKQAEKINKLEKRIKALEENMKSTKSSVKVK